MLGEIGYVLQPGYWGCLNEHKALQGLARLVLLCAHENHGVRTQRVCVDGLDIVSPLDLRPGTLCEVQFRLPVPHSSIGGIRAHARVSHSVLSGRQGGFVIGLRFAEIADDSLAAIRRYLRS